MTAAQVRQTIQAVVLSHVQYRTWYSSWNDVKDLPTERDARFVVWDQWTMRFVEGVNGGLYKTQLIRLYFLSPAASDRAPADRDALVEDAAQAAADIILALYEDHDDAFSIGDMVITTQFDEGVQLDTGVLLQFSARDLEALCLDRSRFVTPDPEP